MKIPMEGHWDSLAVSHSKGKIKQRGYLMNANYNTSLNEKVWPCLVERSYLICCSELLLLECYHEFFFTFQFWQFKNPCKH